MWYKVLAKGSFRFPDLQNFPSSGVEIDASTLRLILDGIDLSSIRRQRRFRKEPEPVTSQKSSEAVPVYQQ